ncbi:hypothetical protein [Microbacterium sp.]|uniref:hypothetical protein n=1 Tax=Microbacterium sp. TaxID=51671 RepID=UPI003F721BE8
MATTWSVSNRTDGRVERDDLPLIPTFRSDVVARLVQLELWVPDGDDAWIIADYARDQTSRTDFEVLENNRRRDREKKRRQRSKSPGTVPGDSPGGLHRQGQARQEQEQGQDDVEVDQQTGQVRQWAARVPGSDDWESPDSPGSILSQRGAA